MTFRRNWRKRILFSREMDYETMILIPTVPQQFNIHCRKLLNAPLVRIILQRKYFILFFYVTTGQDLENN